MMEYEIVRINKLKELENWTSWKFQVRVTLKSCNAWEIVTGESVLSVPKDDGTNRARAIWIKLDIVQCIIATSVDEELLLHTINCESTKDIWKKLESIYE